MPCGGRDAASSQRRAGPQERRKQPSGRASWQ